MCAACGGQGFPTTPGVVGPTRNSNNCNLGVIKMDFETSVTADASINFEADVDTVCDNLVVKFTNGPANANQFFWDFGWFWLGFLYKLAKSACILPFSCGSSLGL